MTGAKRKKIELLNEQGFPKELFVELPETSNDPYPGYSKKDYKEASTEGIQVAVYKLVGFATVKVHTKVKIKHVKLPKAKQPERAEG